MRVPSVTRISYELLPNLVTQVVTNHLLPNFALGVRHLQKLDDRLILLNFLYIFLGLLD